MTPVATNVLRVLKAPARIGGLDLPAGVGVSASIYLTHHRPDLWPDPERFAPERFVGARPSPYAFLPFGGGDRRCLGAAFATYEMKVVLAELLARVDLRVAPGYRMRPVLRTVTVAPSAGTFPTNRPLFVGLLVGVLLIIGGLTFFPALALGPVTEQVAMNQGKLYPGP